MPMHADTHTCTRVCIYIYIYSEVWKKKKKIVQENCFDNQKREKRYTVIQNWGIHSPHFFLTKLTSHLFIPTFILSHNFSSRHFECYPKIFLFNFTEFQLIEDLILFLIKIIKKKLIVPVPHSNTKAFTINIFFSFISLTFLFHTLKNREQKGWILIFF